MTTLKTVTQRLFGRTVIDSLDLNQNGWYIDEVQVTASAEDINNAAGSVPVYNGTGGAFTVGMLLHISSYNTASGYYIVEKADANAAGKPAQLIATDTTANGSTTTADKYYSGAALDTAAATIGDPIYLSETAGAYTLTKPTAVDSLVQVVGHVLTKAASGTVVIDLNYGEITQIGSNELQAKCITAAKLGSDVAGDGLSGGNGAAMALDLNELTAATLVASADSIPFIDATGNVSRKETVANVATAMAGSGLAAASGQILLTDCGNIASGGVFFGAKGDCTSVDINSIAYTRDGTPDITVGEWTEGADAAASAANLAAAINGDQRNAGSNYFYALAVGDGVVIYGKAVGTANNVTVVKTGGAQPATVQNLVGGYAVKSTKMAMTEHTVTAFDAALAGFSIILPISPYYWMATIKTSAGVPKAVTDQLTYQNSPDRIQVVFAGATHVVAGDIITVIAMQ